MPHLRERRPHDLPELCHILTQQQPSSGYPFRWPLPIPVASFIARENDVAAWVADAPLSGHVAVGRVIDDDFGHLFSDALGVDASRMRVITALFTSLDARGQRVGNTLLEHAERFIAAQGLVPVLDVLPTHAAAVTLYERRGWRTVAEGRAPWLPDDAPSIRYMALES